MKEVKIEVKNCRNCCFADHHSNTEYQRAYANCLAPGEIHTKYPIDSYYKNYKSPDWCPLKKQSLKIEFKK